MKDEADGCASVGMKVRTNMAIKSPPIIRKNSHRLTRSTRVMNAPPLLLTERNQDDEVSGAGRGKQTRQARICRAGANEPAVKAACAEHPSDAHDRRLRHMAGLGDLLSRFG